MSSYGYGVWLVIDQNYTSNHILHVTLQCNMTKDDAFKLYIDIYKKHGDMFNISVTPEGVIFSTNMYNNNSIESKEGDSWGYNVELLDRSIWNDFKELSSKYKGSFSDSPHVTIEYTVDQGIQNTKPDVVESTLHVADITNNDSSKWFLIK